MGHCNPDTRNDLYIRCGTTWTGLDCATRRKSGIFSLGLSHELYSSHVVHPFVIVVADRDATVGVISSMLLSSALATTLTTVQTQVRVLVEPQFITGVEAPELPEEIRRIEELAISASPADIESASLIVAFSGVDMNKLTELRERGVAVPAVNLCQFVEHLEETAHHKATPQVQVQEVMTSAALQFGFGGGSSTCSICEAQEMASMDYWVSIADTCSRFAHHVQKLQP